MDITSKDTNRDLSIIQAFEELFPHLDLSKNEEEFYVSEYTDEMYESFLTGAIYFGMKLGGDISL